MSATTVRSVHVDQGELRFVVEIGGDEHRVRFGVDPPIVPSADGALPAVLLPAMTCGERLRFEQPIDEALLRNLPDVQAIFRAWADAWPFFRGTPREIEVDATPALADRAPGRAVAAFFSGGVDSFSTVLSHPEITHLVFVHGADLAIGESELAGRVASRLEHAAELLGKSWIAVETDVRLLGDAFVPWDAYFGSVLASVARLLSPAVERIYVASESPYQRLHRRGSHPLIDHLWGGDAIRIVYDGARFGRADKVERIADSEVARQTLRVCWENREAAYNCCRCEKCLRTMVALAMLGVLEEFVTFDRPLDVDAVGAVVPRNKLERDFWEENLELAARTRAAPELVAAIEACLANGYAGRAGKADPVRPPSVADPRIGRLYMRPAAARMLAGARGAAILIGGYEGWGNYGDLVQLEATLDLLGSAAAGVVGCPVISLHTAREHAERRAAGEFSDHAELYYTPPGEDSDPLAAQLGLVPAVLQGPIKALVWLYGGGYLNPAWGVWKLRILEAARSLLQRMGQTDQVLISSGLQVDPGWSRQLSVALRGVLTGLDPLGVRDELSAQAAPVLFDSTTAVLRTGDDAVGILKHADPPDPGPRGDDWSLNLHFCPGEWVADDPARARAWLRDLVAEIARLTGERIRVQPLIAYEDPSLSERADLATLCAELERQSGITSAEPIVLTATAILDHAATVGSARLSVSTSYHVALTSLLLGVPAVLVQETAYYAQKASGLRADFKLPEAAFPDLTEAPDRAASRALAGLGLLGQSTELDLGAARVRALSRRDAAEAELSVRLGEVFEGAEPRPGTRLVSLTARERDAVLGALEQADTRIEALSAESEGRSAQAAWSDARLADITASSSWRLTAPIRRAKAILRQARSRDGG